MNRKRILVVEDDPKSRFAFQSILQDHGHNVWAVASAEEAGSDGQGIDIAVIDVRLPQKNGVDFARELKKRHPDVKIIFVTAYEELKIQPPPLEGAALLLKPLQIDALLKLLG